LPQSHDFLHAAVTFNQSACSHEVGARVHA
jgi:hypothetical protein